MNHGAPTITLMQRAGLLLVSTVKTSEVSWLLDSQKKGGIYCGKINHVTHMLHRLILSASVPSNNCGHGTVGKWASGQDDVWIQQCQKQWFSVSTWAGRQEWRGRSFYRHPIRNHELAPTVPCPYSLLCVVRTVPLVLSGACLRRVSESRSSPAG